MWDVKVTCGALLVMPMSDPTTANLPANSFDGTIHRWPERTECGIMRDKVPIAGAIASLLFLRNSPHENR